MGNVVKNSGGGNLGEGMKEVDGSLIDVCSEYVFEGEKNIGWGEDWERNGLGVYGKRKVGGEKSIEGSGWKDMMTGRGWV